MSKKNMLIAQSGGPSSAINASLCGAIARGMASEKIGNVFGAINGMQGLLEKKLINISEQIKSEDDLDLLIHTPAQAIGSSRYKIPKGEDGDKVFEEILTVFEEFNIGYFFYNGGNDSMDTVYRISEFLQTKGITDIKAIGIPKTIDNDLTCTDHTPGFGSAARYVATSIAEVQLDSYVYPNPSVTIFEVMGRNAGWLTAASILARDCGSSAPDFICLPEVPFDIDRLISAVEDRLSKQTHVVIAISEGIKDDKGNYLADTGAAVDMFGHKTLGGAAVELEKEIKGRLGSKFPKLKTRPIQFATLQRAGAHLAAKVDLDESYQCGFRAVEAALAGKTGIMITINRASNEPYLVSYDEASLDGIANAEKVVPKEWITEDGLDLKQDVLAYLRPLIKGEASEKMRGGLPKFFRFDWTKLVSAKDVK
jgi:6-phosphofructokinase 1